MLKNYAIMIGYVRNEIKKTQSYIQRHTYLITILSTIVGINQQPYSIEYIIRPFRTFFQSLFNAVFVPP